MHVTTDKVIYRPNDVMFIEVLILHTKDFTPITYFKGDEIQFKLYDPANSNIF